MTCIGAVVFTGCDKKAPTALNVDLSALKEVPLQKWKVLLSKSIYFGHQSVGFNLMDGIAAIIKEEPEIAFIIKETTAPSDLRPAVWAHSEIGKNRFPQQKFDDFKRVMERGLGTKTDIAFLKLCYVDVMKGTDVQEVFDQYKKTMADLKKSFPRVQFIYFTVPLTSYENSLSARIKRALGRSIPGDDDNIARDHFNKLVRAEFGLTGNLFDIARIEATGVDDRIEMHEKNGVEFPSMAPEWTYDGGHFTAEGSKMLACEFLLFLADAR
jgi:hypothetical protein